MNAQWAKLLQALREPEAMRGFDAPTWDLVLRQALPTGLIGRLGLQAKDRGFLHELPRPVWQAMESMLSYVERQRLAVEWELTHLQVLFEGFAGPVLLLKGAAYVAADLSAARGRMFSDIDLLVPRALLENAELRLRSGGWFSAVDNPYDERYYRQWMHELPPMLQGRRGTALDLHHRLLPQTARIQTPPEPLLAASRSLPGRAPFAVPEPMDLVLHSACHLFHEGEGSHLLRDLSDIDTLLRVEMALQGEALWPRLIERSLELNLQRPLFYALRFAQRLLALPVPEAVSELLPVPPRWQKPLMDALFVRAFSMAHTPSRLRGSGMAALALYVRGHALRMPLPLLIPHLVRKAVMGWQEAKEEEEPSPAGPEQADTRADLR
ncbi:MAG: nucleotidyltransferase family protein [Burkholderiales bacterium]|nr:nucleotidyltransferase family protein [Burkholderiales bacterium]